MKIIISGVVTLLATMGLLSTSTQPVEAPTPSPEPIYMKVDLPFDQTNVISPSKWMNLSHEQEVWIHALEWCESRGVKTAINPLDNDGTPSYYSFQFKPETFKNYGIKFGLLKADISDEEIMEKIKDYDLQKEIVTDMLLNMENLSNQFPNCVRQLGRPSIF
jgi:hypothetical protein